MSPNSRWWIQNKGVEIKKFFNDFEFSEIQHFDARFEFSKKSAEKKLQKFRIQGIQDMLEMFNQTFDLLAKNQSRIRKKNLAFKF